MREHWARIATLVFSGGIAGALFLLGLADAAIATLDPHGAAAAGTQASPALIVCGGLGLAAIWPQARVALARLLPIDPESPVHVLALVLTLTLFGLQLQSALSNVLSQEAGSAQPLNRLDLVLGELPFLLIAIAGVGLVVRRNPSAAADRLGYRRPAWWHVVLALAAAGGFFALAIGFDQLGQVLTPHIAQEVNSANTRIFGDLTADPTGVVTLAVAAGVCEEALFRGALQPRLGILWTSLVFASVHTQYGLSFDALAVFVLALGLGLLRRFLSTTASTICHVAYDLLAGFGLSGIFLTLGGVLEGLLTLLLLAALLLHLRGRTAAAAPS